MRWVTLSENQMNQKKQTNTSSIYKGVYWNKEKSKWAAKIHFYGTKTHLGYFHDEQLAAIAYDEKARKLFGQCAKLNFP